MEIIKLITLILGATGFWRLVEILVKRHGDKKLKKAETNNLYAQANNQIIENWVGWSQKLEQRVKELENSNTEMKQTIDEQKTHIQTLQTRIEHIENRNQELITSLEELKKQHYDH